MDTSRRSNTININMRGYSYWSETAPASCQYPRAQHTHSPVNNKVAATPPTPATNRPTPSSASQSPSPLATWPAHQHLSSSGLERQMLASRVRREVSVQSDSGVQLQPRREPHSVMALSQVRALFRVAYKDAGTQTDCVGVASGKSSVSIGALSGRDEGSGEWLLEGRWR